ncbi:hypothetical protein DM01DRAFT_1336407 [Hesseltinella vesiculosa]|uniref:Uncharacterized protein n=1 Tax=Hesseltinella vesiculosa TaxID=101127 RepID=A0A1X2GGN1_9FUNG|nr:hypothetical protein DM01DRAFT_1336407 [Hesseltinella vesiculosa]
MSMFSVVLFGNLWLLATFLVLTAITATITPTKFITVFSISCSHHLFPPNFHSNPLPLVPRLWFGLHNHLIHKICFYQVML